MIDRIAKRRSGTYPLQVSALDTAGQPATITSGVSISILDGVGTSVHTGVPSVAAGKLTYALPYAALPALDTYEAVWRGVVGGVEEEWVTPFELVGAHYFTISALRNERKKELSDAARFPDDDLRDRRTEAEQFLEDRINCAFVPRGRRETLRGHGRTNLVLRKTYREVREVVSCTVDGTAIDVADLVVQPYGVIEREAGWDAGAVIEIHYTHGSDEPPADVRSAALIYAADRALPSNLPARATAQTIGDQTFRITVAGRDGDSGIPFVDSVIKHHSDDKPAVG